MATLYFNNITIMSNINKSINDSSRETYDKLKSKLIFLSNKIYELEQLKTNVLIKSQEMNLNQQSKTKEFKKLEKLFLYYSSQITKIESEIDNLNNKLDIAKKNIGKIT